MLKPAIITFCITIACLGHSYAAFKLPDSVLDIEEIEKAQESSNQTGKPIAVIYTSCETSCGLVKWATEVIIEKLGSKTILVSLPYRSEKPDFLEMAYKEGRFVPKVAVLDASLEHIIGETHYEEIKKDKNEAFEALLKKINEYKSKHK